MAIKKGDIVKITYTGKLEDGGVFETTDEAVAKKFGVFDEGDVYEPKIVLIGSGVLVEGFEEDLPGKKAGYEGSVTVPPEKGFGIKRAELIKTVPQKKFKDKIEVGYEVMDEEGMAIIANISGGRVKLDYNHPLAGKTLIYDYKIEDVVEGLKDKVAAVVEGYIGPGVNHEVEGDTVTIDVPEDLRLVEDWTIAKLIIARFLTSFVGMKKVVFRETYTEEDLKEEPEE